MATTENATVTRKASLAQERNGQDDRIELYPDEGATRTRRKRRWSRAGAVGGMLAAGVAMGMALGILLAPRSGSDTRHFLSKGSRRLGARVGDFWDDLRDDLSWAARRGPRRLRRAGRRGSWAAEDVYDLHRRFH